MKSVRVGVMLGMLMLAVACAKTKRNPGLVPSGGDGNSQGGAAGEAGTDGGGTMSANGGSAGAAPATDGLAGCANEEPLGPSTATKSCDACPKSLIWRVQNGGVLGSELNCASYRFQDAPCALELACESETAEQISVADVAAALRDPDVNQGRQSYGRDTDRTTGPIVWQIWNDGGPIFVGPACDGYKDCVDAPPGVLRLLSLLQALDAQEAYSSADFCAEHCPAAFDATLVGRPCLQTGLVCSALPGCNGAPAPGLACEDGVWTPRAPK